MKQGSTSAAVTITILIMIILAGAGYYYLDQKNRNDKDSLNGQISSLNSQISDLSKDNTATVATTGSSSGTVASSEWLYANDTYGFSLTFNTKWSGYKMKMADIAGETAAYYVNVPTTDTKWSDKTTAYTGMSSVFALSVFSKSQWSAYQATGSAAQTKIGETAKYIVTYSPAQALPSDLQKANIASDVKNVVATFKAI